MAKCSTDTCCLTLPLRLEKWQEDRLAKRFEIARQIYNTMVRAELKKLRAMEQSEPYKANQEKIQALDWKTQTDKQALKALYKERDKLLRDGGFSEYGFKSDIKNYYKHFNNNIGMERAQIAAKAFTGQYLRNADAELSGQICSFTQKTRKTQRPLVRTALA